VTTPTIPVVDLAAALADEAPAELLDAVRVAAEQIGIIQVTGHGVDQALIDGFGRRAGRLLSLPRAEKAKLASPTGHPYRGWRQWPDDFGRLELERFNVGQFDNAADARAAGVAEEHVALWAHANVWPPDDPQLRAVTHAYIDASRGVAEQLLRLYGKVLGTGEATFPRSELPYLTLTVNNYPTWTYPDTPSDEDKLLLLEHADGSALTVLAQEGDYEGLQVQLPDGSWLPVPIVPGALQVFSGTLLARWTNGRLRGVRHRVVAGGSVTRRSTAVFYYPSLETVVEPLAPFQADDSDYEPVLLWDQVGGGVDDYLKVFGRPEQVAAWREGRPYVAELADNSAGR
jgi:isopenicillin N synthase-like dioxygenase